MLVKQPVKQHALVHRDSPRVPFGGSVVAHTRPEAQLEGLNLSVGGIRLSGTVSLTIGSEFSIQFHIDGTTKPLVTQGKVTWVLKQSVAERPTMAYGITFKDLSAQGRETIERFIAEQLS